VDNLEAIAERLATAGSKPRDDVNEALGVGKGEHKYNVEVKYSGPDNVMLDVSEPAGWAPPASVPSTSSRPCWIS